MTFTQCQHVWHACFKSPGTTQLRHRKPHQHPMHTLVHPQWQSHGLPAVPCAVVHKTYSVALCPQWHAAPSSAKQQLLGVASAASKLPAPMLPQQLNWTSLHARCHPLQHKPGTPCQAARHRGTRKRGTPKPASSTNCSRGERARLPAQLGWDEANRSKHSAETSPSGRCAAYTQRVSARERSRNAKSCDRRIPEKTKRECKGICARQEALAVRHARSRSQPHAGQQRRISNASENQAAAEAPMMLHVRIHLVHSLETLAQEQPRRAARIGKAWPATRPAVQTSCYCCWCQTPQASVARAIWAMGIGLQTCAVGPLLLQLAAV